MTTKFGKKVNLEELTQIRLIKQVLVTSSHQDHVIISSRDKLFYLHYQNAYGYQTWQGMTNLKEL